MSSNSILLSMVSQLPSDKQKIYNEWVRRSSRYRDPLIYLYLACDHKRQVCKVGISVRKPQVRLWDIGFECIHEWYLPNKYARNIEAFITAKYSDKWLREGNQAYNGRRECYPFGLATELFNLINKLLGGYIDLPKAQVNGRSVKVIPELMESIRVSKRGDTVMKLYSYVSANESPILMEILMSSVPQLKKPMSKPIGKGNIVGGSGGKKFMGAKPMGMGGIGKNKPMAPSKPPMGKGMVMTKPTSSIGTMGKKRDQGTPKPGGTPMPPPRKPKSVSLGSGNIRSGMNINSGIR